MTELERFKLAKAKGYTYDPITGELRGIFGKVIRGKTNSYISCSIYFGKEYQIRAHRLCWYLYYGELPKNHIDHIDGNKSNNKIDNLRDVTHQQNHFNRTTARGYIWTEKEKKFKSYATHNAKKVHLGYFNTKEEAHEAYLEYKKTHYIIPQDEA